MILVIKNKKTSLHSVDQKTLYMNSVSEHVRNRLPQNPKHLLCPRYHISSTIKTCPSFSTCLMTYGVHQKWQGIPSFLKGFFIWLSWTPPPISLFTPSSAFFLHSVFFAGPPYLPNYIKLLFFHPSGQGSHSDQLRYQMLYRARIIHQLPKDCPHSNSWSLLSWEEQL